MKLINVFLFLEYFVVQNSHITRNTEHKRGSKSFLNPPTYKLKGNLTQKEYVLVELKKENKQ